MTRLTPWWLRLTSLFLLAVLAGVFTGCSTPVQGIVQVSPDTYLVTVQKRTGIFSNEVPNLKAQAISESMDFAESKGKAAVPANLTEDTFSMIGDYSKIEYRFKLVDKDDPRVKRTSIATGRDSVVVKDDVYVELSKLDALRKKGILTEAEFQSEKQKLLNRPK